MAAEAAARIVAAAAVAGVQLRVCQLQPLRRRRLAVRSTAAIEHATEPVVHLVDWQPRRERQQSESPASAALVVSSRSLQKQGCLVVPEQALVARGGWRWLECLHQLHLAAVHMGRTCSR